MARCSTYAFCTLLSIWLCLIDPGNAAPETSVAAIARKLIDAPAGQAVDFSAQDFTSLDLSELDFKGANLQRVTLFGADLSGANLSNTDLSGAMLDRVTIVGANFANANLKGASFLRPSVFSTLAQNAREAPSFKNANLSNVRMFGRFTRADFSGADLSDVTCAPFGKTGFIENIWRTELSGANLSGAKLVRADLTHALLTFADLRGANLQNAILKDADLAGADLRGADLTGADLTGADLSGARIQDIVGLGAAKGLGQALNVEKAVR